MALWHWYAKQSFMWKMTTGFVLGIVFGIVLGEYNTVFSPLGKLFLNLLKMIVVPLVIVSLVVAVNHSNPKELGRIGLKIFPAYLIFTGISVVVGILWAKLTHPGVGLTLPTNATVTPPQKPFFIDTLPNMVPSNIFEAISGGNILAVVFVSLVFGIAILLLRHSKSPHEQLMGNRVYELIEACNEIVQKVLQGILQYAPIGVFGITANTIGSQGLDTVIALGKFVGTAYLGVISLFVVVFPLAMKLFGISAISFYKNIKEAMLTAFATSSSLSTIPITLAAAERAGINEQVARLTIPIGATANMNGTALRFGVAVIFAMEITGVSMGIPELAMIVIIGTMAAVGTAGVPGAGLIGMSIVFTQAGLPIEIVALTAGVNVLLDMIFTCGNVTGDLVAAKIVDQLERKAQKRSAVES